MSNSKVYVGNLSFNTTENDLKNKFNSHGDITDINIIKDRVSGVFIIYIPCIFRYSFY